MTAPEVRPLDAGETVLVVGASLAGMRTAEALRGGGFAGPIVVLGAEPHQPYDRPPLSKEVLRGDLDPADLALHSAERLRELDLDLRLGTRARGLDLERRTVACEDGELVWDRLVIATGCRPRTLPGCEGLVGVHLVRTLDDAAALRRELAGAGRVAIVGGGFIGGEVAASARALGAEVTIVEVQEAPLVGVLGPVAARLYRELHEACGVRLRCGVGVAGPLGAGRVTGIRLGGGEELEADLVVVAIGVEPETEWLAGSGLRLDNGVLCDPDLSVAADVYVAGDIARWPDREGVPIRVEHWTNACEQGAHVARNLIAGARAPYDSLPYFWSDQHGTRIQYAGRRDPGDEIQLFVAADEPSQVIGLYVGEDGAPRAVLAFGVAAAFTRIRHLLHRGGGRGEALALLEKAGFVAAEPAAVSGAQLSGAG